MTRNAFAKRDLRSIAKRGLRPIALNPTIPPLENGDRLTQAEFERRYDAMAVEG
ncbi:MULTISPECIES: hypothetical protein [unclassified Moorena]|uniref:hypothetical protein n=1 Tax=unclassified Moorena TaxID=2683338 RepID=UPI0003090547|nr:MULTISPECIES: hypothetical protein [unclassified Moorena]